MTRRGGEFKSLNQLPNTIHNILKVFPCFPSDFKGRLEVIPSFEY